ncbi:VWA domain-containing protein [Dongia soli]|uniref:VWA domain-containing protein n=1 Tax=Dongia soli TaxID=600628 RepID=A0ABU5E9A7_9PROT|nr:VWA domain-containing protein [Dongia soli]MDY0882502.1 VWA domain-containing protein [Dongia soli]
MQFARTLRAAGLPIGPGKVIDAVEALQAAGIGSRADFYWVLHAVFVQRREQREIFDQAFHIFWKNPEFLKRMMSLLLPSLAIDQHDPAKQQEINRRLAEALKKDSADQLDDLSNAEEKLQIDAAMTYSQREILQRMDFDKMSMVELQLAKKAIAQLRLPIMEVPTRRFRRDDHGQIVDMRGTLRASLRHHGTIPLRLKSPRPRHPPLVILCDISGSMSRYARLALHFVHAITNDRDRVHTFLFGTRLSNITRHLRHRDVDIALDLVAEHVVDWSGGTRIGSSLAEFNLRWARRVLAQGAVILLISDGLERDDGEILEREIARLHRSCRHLIWLNPLLRYDAYEPLSRGAGILIKHVDDFRPIHNLNSMQDLAEALSGDHLRRSSGMRGGLAA